MTFWIVVGLLTLAVLAAVVTPILRARAAARRAADYDIEVYRDQLAEVDRNLKRGLIQQEEADAAKAEIGRRILEADQRRQAATSQGGASRTTVRAAAVLVALAVPAGALAVYLAEGRPGLEGQPFASRDLPESARTTTTGRGGGGGMAAMQGGGGQPQTDTSQGRSAAQSQGEGRSLAQMEADLTSRLMRNPDDLRGWLLLGRTRMAMQRYGAAADALQEAAKRAPDDPRVQGAYGEALVMANDGTVTPKAQEAFRTVNREAPQDPRARFYLGLAEQQAGNPEQALEIWRRLVADADPGAPYLEVVAQHMAQAERALGKEPGTTFAEVKPQGTATAQAGQAAGAGQDGGQRLGPTRERARQMQAERQGQDAGPTREQVEQAQNMSADNRQKMIRGMVEGLAKRLEENPQNAQGWQRLIRSYSVLGEGEKAAGALADALAAYPEQPEVRRQLKLAAQRQGVAMPEGVDAPEANAAGASTGDRQQAGQQQAGQPQAGQQQAGGAQGGQGSGAPGAGQMPEMSEDQRRQMLQQVARGLSNQLERNPDDVGNWVRLGQTYLSLDKPEKAVDAYAKAAELKPEDPDVLLSYARALRRQAGTQTETSVELTRKVLDKRPDNPEALWFGAMAELREGDKDAAREMFDKALKQLPPDTPQTAELRKRADEMLKSN